MVDQIINNIDKTCKDVAIMDILNNHIQNAMLKDKWAFSLNTYNNLINSITSLQQGDTNPIIKNYIINDYETLSQMIREFKEDLYPYFDSNVIVLLDSLSKKELMLFQSFEKDILNKYHHFHDYLEILYLNALDDVKPFINKLITQLKKQLSSNELKFIPFASLEMFLKLDKLDQNLYLQLYQLITKVIKYLNDKDEFTKMALESKFNVIIIIAGEKNV